jgi:hypothetical protein
MLPYLVDLELFTEPGILELAIQDFLPNNKPSNRLSHQANRIEYSWYDHIRQESITSIVSVGTL